MLNLFAGRPLCGLKSHGLEALMVNEDLGEVEMDSAIQYRKEGVFIGTETDREFDSDVEYRISDRLIQDGITWDWFPENWTWGNRIGTQKTFAAPEYRTVVQGTNLTTDEFLDKYGELSLSAKLVKIHDRHDGWLEYEARWLPGKCPQQSHMVLTTWVITTHPMPEFAYQRLRELIEDPTAILKNPELYGSQHRAKIYKWDGKPRHRRGSM
jgi:hypothetical protein